MPKTNKRTKKILNDNWESIVRQVAAGETYSSLAAQYGVSRQALSARVKKKGLTTAPTVGAKILVLDIENAPMTSYHWGLWQQNIGNPMRLEGDRSYMMSCALKWVGEDEVFYYETRNEDDSQLIKDILPFIEAADFIVGHNAKKFDMKKINAYAILNNQLPPSPYRVIDTMLIAKKYFSFERNTLDYLTKALCTETKSAHGKFQGFELWSECIKGNEEAWAEMRHYNIQDIISTEELYIKLRPWDKGHPNITTTSGSLERLCPTCASNNLISNGYSTTNLSQFKRYLCEDCGAHSRGRASQIGKLERSKLLMPIING